MKKKIFCLMIFACLSLSAFARNPFSITLGAFGAYDMKDKVDFGLNTQIRKDRFLWDFNIGTDASLERLALGTYFGGSVFSNEAMYVGIEGGVDWDFSLKRFRGYQGLFPNVRLSYCYTFPFGLDLRPFVDLGTNINLNEKSINFGLRTGLLISYSFDLGSPRHEIKKQGLDEAYFEEQKKIERQNRENLETERDYWKEKALNSEIVKYVAVDKELLYPNLEKGSVEDKVEENKERNTIKADSNTYFAGVLNTYIYDRTKIFEVFCSPLNVTDIRLEENEQVISCVLGNIASWTYDVVIAPEDNKNYTHLLFRPNNYKISTDAVVYTDKRVYRFRLYSTEQDKAQVGIEFLFPESKTLSSSTLSFSSSEKYLSTENLNFNYKILGNENFKPKKVFSDGSKTYIQFANSFLRSSEIPVVLLRNRVDEKEELVAFLQKGINFILPCIIQEEQEIVLRIDEREITIQRDYTND